MLHRILLIILTLVSFECFGQRGAFQLPEGRKSITSSFSNYDNMVVVEMTIADTIPVRLILDSGIEGIILTDRTVVERLNSVCTRVFNLTAPGTDITLDACITSSLKIKFPKLLPITANVILLQEDYFSLESFIGAKVHGLIGLEKFRNMIVSINYDKNTIKFTDPYQYNVPKNAEIIPLFVLRGRPYLSTRVELDTKEIRDLWLMIDSGANHPLLLETDSTETYKPLQSLKTTIGRGLGGTINGEFVRSGWLLIGNSRLDNIITSISSEYLTGNPASRNFRDGTLGSGALARFRVSFDYINSRLILEKGIKFKEPFEYNMSGITFECINRGFNIFKVSEIIYDSPSFHSGIHPEDVLMSINGKAAYSLNLGELNAILSAKPGNLITMVISRKGEVMTFKFRLKRLI
ncbi:MAG TPA: hypothetical protein VK212_08885 [Lentimicrobium sp.]|nr:hypothetical protein [Lentimicrobium sp.]